MSKLSLAFKGQTLKTFPVSPGTMLIGCDPACHIHIDSLAVLPTHARIETEEGNSILYNMAGKEGIYVNHQKSDQQHPLKDGDLIRVGKHTLSYAYEKTSPDNEPIPDPFQSLVELQQPILNNQPVKKEGQQQGWLQILNGQNLGKTLSLHRQMTNLGKRGVATAVITRQDDGYFISHLEGKYPPLVDDTPIGERSYLLSDGETIQIGNIRLQFYLE